MGAGSYTRGKGEAISCQCGEWRAPCCLTAVNDLQGEARSRVSAQAHRRPRPAPMDVLVRRVTPLEPHGQPAAERSPANRGPWSGSAQKDFFDAMSMKVVMQHNVPAHQIGGLGSSGLFVSPAHECSAPSSCTTLPAGHRCRAPSLAGLTIAAARLVRARVDPAAAGPEVRGTAPTPQAPRARDGTVRGSDRDPSA